jgi:peptide/nickel transport system substrate-binding protein
LLLASLIFWGGHVYQSRTKAIPDFGGEYIEGSLGQPLHINPLLAQSNDIDSDLSEIIYSGLLKYDANGNLTNDLVESYEISDDKLTYTMHLKQNVLWHDGEKLTAKDVVFTINLLSNPSYKSPLRSNWQGIETDLVDDYTLTFKINTPFVGFLSNLTFGILPEHIWGSIEPEKFSITRLNLEPIGSGPYKYDSMQKDSNDNIFSYKLISNPNYFDGKPYISKITFNFYSDEDKMVEAYNRKEIMGISGMSTEKTNSLKLSQSTLLHKLEMPRYFAVFINQTKSAALANDEVRTALAYATNRNELIEKVLDGNGRPIFSPILPGMLGYDETLDKRDFDLEKANQILEDKGWKKGDDGFRGKNGVPLEFTLITAQWDELSQTAQLLKEQWGKIGAKVNINILSVSDIQQNYIRPREYDALLFGQVLGSDPDLSSFWHSSQKKDPGLNLSLFGDGTTDKLIDDGRSEFDPEKRAAIYREFQYKLNQEIPAVFLYSPDFIYPINKKVQGIEIKNLTAPSQRFSDVNKWYIKTKRVKK